MCSFVRHSTMAILLILCFVHARSQTNRCDSIQWNFDVNQFAIDGDNLMADFAEKGWTEEFFQTNEIDVTIYGATDCPGSYAYNSKLAGNRALYLRNYFEVSAFPKLTIANSYAIPERNCVKPGQGYNRADRVTALKVCWAGESSTVVAQNNRQEVKEVVEKQKTGEASKEVVVRPTNTNEVKETASENTVNEAKSNYGTNTVVDAVAEVKTTGTQTTEEVEATTSDSLQTQQVLTDATLEVKIADTQAGEEQVKTTASDSLQTQQIVIAETSAVIDSPVDSAYSAANDMAIEVVDESARVDSINVLALDSTYTLPVKPKKVFDEESMPELNKGDEVIMEGLNFYPGSHRTLPEAKPILKKLLQVLKENPTLMIEIQGHVCCASKPNEDGLDDETGDFKLSWNRAQYVRDYLIQNGIAENRISYRGFAMTRPLVYPEKTIQDQIKNRRVEILVTAE
jgi:outer membrane protein OmpA-like peptidoglycan-associated protein